MVEESMITVTIEYDGGLNPMLDATITKIAKIYEGEPVGSGCLLIAPFTRDLQFSFESLVQAREYEAYLDKHYPLDRVVLEDETTSTST